MSGLASPRQDTSRLLPSGLLGLGIGLALAMVAVCGGDGTRHAADHPHGSVVPEGAAIAGRPATTVRPLACERLADVPGKTLRTVLVDFPPNAYTPRHRHPGSVSAFVVQGTLRSQLDGGPVETFTVGQTWFESVGAVHDFAQNASATEPAQLLAVFVTDADCGPLTIFE